MEMDEKKKELTKMSRKLERLQTKLMMGHKNKANIYDLVEGNRVAEAYIRLAVTSMGQADAYIQLAVESMKES